MVDELAEEYQGQVSFAKVNIDDSPALATKYSVRAIPTLLIFKDSKPVKQVVGLRPKSELRRFLTGLLV